MRSFLLLTQLAFCLLSSCKDEEIRTYRVATETPAETPPPASTPPLSASSTPAAVGWLAPPDWLVEKPGQFLTAAYSVPSGGRVTVSKLNGDGGGLAANINRWRGQVGLEPLAEHDLKGQPLKVPESSFEMQLFNLTAVDAAAETEGILAAILPLKSETWYFKFTGPTAVLRKNESLFAEFLGSIRVGARPPSSPALSTSKKIKVSPPEAWKASEGSSMRAASFGITGAAGSSADVSVVPIPGDSGSILDNVNRWRAQLKLPPLSSPDDPALGKKSESPLGEVFTSHMTSTEPILNGKQAAIASAILKRPGMTWFFKITGDATLVEASREAFATFVNSATFPD